MYPFSIKKEIICTSNKEDLEPVEVGELAFFLWCCSFDRNNYNKPNSPCSDTVYLHPVDVCHKGLLCFFFLSLWMKHKRIHMKSLCHSIVATIYQGSAVASKKCEPMIDSVCVCVLSVSEPWESTLCVLMCLREPWIVCSADRQTHTHTNTHSTFCSSMTPCIHGCYCV